jgi:hypothetical protein
LVVIEDCLPGLKSLEENPSKSLPPLSFSTMSNLFTLLSCNMCLLQVTALN